MKGDNSPVILVFAIVLFIALCLGAFWIVGEATGDTSLYDSLKSDITTTGIIILILLVLAVVGGIGYGIYWLYDNW